MSFTSRWSYRCSFSTSSYCRGLSMSFLSGACCRSRCNFSMSFFSIRSWGLIMSFFTCCWSRRSTFSTSSCYRLFCMSFFTSYRCSFCMCFGTSSYCRRFCMSFFSSSYRCCRLSCFGTSSYCRVFSSTSGRSFSMSFFTNCWSRRSTFSTSCYSWRFSMGFFTSCRCSFCMCFRTSCYSWSAFSVSFFTCYRSSRGLSVSFFTSCRLFSSSVRRSFCMSFFSCTSCYCRSTFSTSSSWGFSMSFFSSSYRCCRLSCFGTSCYCRLFSMSFFTSGRLNCRSTFSTSSYSRSWSFCMSFTSGRLIYYRSCRLFSSTSCWSSWSITCLICWVRFIFTSSTIICINHEVRI